LTQIRKKAKILKREVEIRKGNTSKCSKRCRQVKKAFASKVKEQEEGSNAY
jgi:NMD protein affecting ribosome stability and mRNA decay